MIEVDILPTIRLVKHSVVVSRSAPLLYALFALHKQQSNCGYSEYSLFLFTSTLIVSKYHPFTD